MATVFTVAQYISVRSSFDPNDPDVQTLIAMAEEEVANNFCNETTRNKAVALVVMHWLSLPKDDSGNNSVTGSVKSEKEGRLSRTFGFHGKVDFTNNAYWSQTSYGLELLTLQNSCFIKPTNRAALWLR